MALGIKRKYEIGRKKEEDEARGKKSSTGDATGRAPDSAHSDVTSEEHWREGKSRQDPSSFPHVFVLLGDSEMSEGQVWEAIQIASHYNLNSLCAICDVNRLGQSTETMLGW
ncbi:hypothetical protein HYT33_01295, partial [Candidatus Roizmanbacteria bacterium]|nr:hypothetical protein [Candidatus Roizmanbacteria bacterium]